MYTIANIRPFGHNVGNTAISFALKNMLYDSFGRLVTVIDYPATGKYETTSKAGLSKQTIHDINRFADGVIIGGGNLFENDEIDVNFESLKHLQPLLCFSLTQEVGYMGEMANSKRELMLYQIRSCLI